MGPLAAGQIVLIPFPFSDLSQTKLRPALVIAGVGRGDWVLCQITSKPYGDSLALELAEQHFESGSLRVISYARPGKLFTANDHLIVRQVGKLHDQRLQEIVESVITLIRSALPSSGGSASQ